MNQASDIVSDIYTADLEDAVILDGAKHTQRLLRDITGNEELTSPDFWSRR